MGVVSGIVKEGGTPVPGRIVRAYRRDTGALLGEDITSPGGLSPGDSNFWNVASLLHMTGANGSTVFTDSSQNNPIWTPAGGAQIVTDAGAFGGSSAYFNGSGAFITTPSTPALTFGVADVTVELFVRAASISGNAIVVGKHYGNSGSWIVLRVGGLLYLYVSSTGSTWDIMNGVLIGAISVDTRYHVAWSRHDGVFRTFLGGSMGGSSSSPLPIFNGTQAVVIGANPSGGDYFAGYIDEVRVKVGEALYTENFDPPSQPFYDAAPSPLPPLGSYSISTSYTGEVQVVCLDDAVGTTYNDLIARTTPA